MVVPNFKCGFSVYPPLQPTPENTKRYSIFLARLASQFGGRTDANALSADKRILITPYTPRADPALVSEDTSSAFYCFMLPGQPKIPANPQHCDQFLSFSLEFRPDVGLEKSIVEGYVAEVYRLFKECFGDSMKLTYWHGLRRTLSNKQRGYYTPEDVEKAEAEVRRLSLTGSDFGSKEGGIVA
ncbi:Ff.00g007430.m01.CDS01 [Fusarium sp. VM40]|nr:Ff.00g007430.m01.CDS01 [Fusarium sp. VM40]